MAAQNKMEIPQQEAGYEHPTPPPTPVKGALSDTETIQDQPHQRIEVVSPASATDTFPSEPSNLD